VRRRQQHLGRVRRRPGLARFPAARFFRLGSEAASDAPKCAYERMSPQPLAGSISYRPGRPGEDGAVYEVRCEGGRTVWMWLPDGAAPETPAIDPAVVARRAVDQMELKGPDIASPRAAGRYLVGMPM
jgi:hypothetical protein